MRLEKIGAETSDQLRQASRELSSIAPVAMELNGFASALVERLAGRQIDEKALTLFIGVEGYIGIETRNRLGHCVLRAHIDIPEGQRAVVGGDQPILLSDEEGELLLSDIHSSIDSNRASRFAKR